MRENRNRPLCSPYCHVTFVLYSGNAFNYPKSSRSYDSIVDVILCQFDLQRPNYLMKEIEKKEREKIKKLKNK